METIYLDKDEFLVVGNFDCMFSMCENGVGDETVPFKCEGGKLYPAREVKHFQVKLDWRNSPTMFAPFCGTKIPSAFYKVEVEVGETVVRITKDIYVNSRIRLEKGALLAGSPRLFGSHHISLRIGKENFFVHEGYCDEVARIERKCSDVTDIQKQLDEVKLEEAAKGCSDCNGQGKILLFTSFSKCCKCDGQGYI